MLFVHGLEVVEAHVHAQPPPLRRRRRVTLRGGASERGPLGEEGTQRLTPVPIISKSCSPPFEAVLAREGPREVEKEANRLLLTTGARQLEEARGVDFV